MRRIEQSAHNARHYRPNNTFIHKMVNTEDRTNNELTKLQTNA